MNGVELLNAYRRGSEEAFAELVSRYSAFIYSTARRRLCHSHLAEEVTQTVFLRLVKSAPRFSHEGGLSAWLHRTTLHVSVDLWRSETRRRDREQKALEMNSGFSEPSQDVWQAIEPELDNALNQLSDTDRQTILLRFFQRCSMRDIAKSLGVSEDAAKMRVSRAVERLRGLIPSAGAATVTAFAALLETHVIEAAPVSLLARLASPNFIPAASTSVLALMMKTKLALGLASAVVFGTALHFWKSSDERAVENSTVRAPETPASVTPQQQSLLLPANRKPAGFPQKISASAIEEAKRALAALLQNPPRASSYPPPELKEVLSRFWGQFEEAMPLLLEAAARDDYETRQRALSGLQFVLQLAFQSPDYASQAEELFRASHPTFKSVLQGSGEPISLRMTALLAYEMYLQLSPTLTHGNETLEDLFAVLGSTDKSSSGFRFTLLDRTGGLISSDPALATRLAQELKGFLQSNNRDQRLLGAYGLASDPGESFAKIKAILEKEIAERSGESYRAAIALGKLGPLAADAVPRLLEYARLTEGWGGGGYSRNALKAACQIDPSLRPKYPEIDAALRQDEDVRERPASPRIYAGLPEVAEQPPGVEIRPPVEIPCANLVLEARVLLGDKSHPKEKEFLAILEQLNAIGQEPVTQSNFARIQEALNKVDPEFAKEWQAEVLKNTPWLDRVVNEK